MGQVGCPCSQGASASRPPNDETPVAGAGAGEQQPPLTSPEAEPQKEEVVPPAVVVNSRPILEVEIPDVVEDVCSLVPDVPFAKWDVVVNHDADFIDFKTGKRRSRALDHEFVHGSAYALLVNQERAKSQHNNLDSPFGFEQATAIAHRAIAMAAQAAAEVPDITHDKWGGPGGRCPIEALFDESDLPALCEAVQANCEALHETALAGPTLNVSEAPTKVFGDIHGQFRDLLLFFHYYGFPSFDGPCFVFNGDWVDRGAQQVEVVSLIYALKLAFPKHVFLNRGNHEDKVINKHMGDSGFEQACITKFGRQRGKKLFLCFAKSFECLPLATVIADKILVVHGGIGSGNWDLEKLKDTKRPLTSRALGEDEMLYNLLWSDPVDEDERASFGVHDSPRDDHSGLVKRFGQDVTEKFLTRNGLRMIIRSHQSQTEGDGYEVMHGGRLIRVFSARDYDDEDNDGSILSVDLVPSKHQVVVRPQCLQSVVKNRDGDPAAPRQ